MSEPEDVGPDAVEPDEHDVEPGDQKPKRKRKGRRRFTWWIGMGMVLAGLAILAWLAWEYFGTNVVAKREQRKEVAQYEKCEPNVGPPAVLRIPRFGDKYVVPINDGVSNDVLSKGVGHFMKTGPDKSTYEPGDPGNYALAGHRITHGQPFADMPDLRAGDKIRVSTCKDHIETTFVYVLDTNAPDLVVPFTAGWVLAPDPKNPRGGVQADQTPTQCPGQTTVTIPCIITLTTCSELFHTDNRMIAFGHLVDIEKKRAK